MIHRSGIIFGVSCSNVTPYAFQIVLELETFYLPIASTQYGNFSPKSQITAISPPSRFSHVRAYKVRLDFGIKTGLRDETNVYMLLGHKSVYKAEAASGLASDRAFITMQLQSWSKVLGTPSVNL